jgi:hypothetical protein
VVIAEPMLSTSAAVDVNMSGALTKYDISPVLPLDGDPPRSTPNTRDPGLGYSESRAVPPASLAFGAN